MNIIDGPQMSNLILFCRFFFQNIFNLNRSPFVKYKVIFCPQESMNFLR